MQQGFTSPTGVMDKLEDAQVTRQLFLRDATMRAEPGAQQRPEPFHGIDMDFMKSIAILITGILASGVIDTLMLIAPLGQTVVDVILICVHQAARCNRLSDHRFDCHLLHIRQHADDHLTVTLEQSQDGRLLVRQRPPSALALQSSPTPFSAFLSHNLWVAFVPCYDVHFVGFDFARQLYRLFLTTMPSRNCVVIVCASPTDRSSSSAICSLDRFRPMKYRHSTQTRRG